MNYYCEFFPYQRSFIKPLNTYHGVWKVREGIIVKLTNDYNQIGWGEIAPLPWFGTETLEDALSFCQQLGKQITCTQITEIPNHCPACQFGFESATLSFSEKIFPPNNTQKFCYLLPTGEAALSQYQWGYQQGYRTFKWKIGVSDLNHEIELFKKLIDRLPNQTKLRLDANGGLTFQEAEFWLNITDKLDMIEFIEQPLPPNQLDDMLALSRNYQTRLALDESVAQLTQLKHCYQQGWRGIFIIKAAIMGFPSHLRQFCQTNSMDLVFSSVFETAIGRNFILNWATKLMTNDRAFGFGVNDWFDAHKN